MNTIYKHIWSVATGKLVVASELAKGRKKIGGRKALVGALAIAFAVSAPFGAAFAAATTAPVESCTTMDGKSGALNTSGVCAVDTVVAPPPKNSRSIGVFAGSNAYEFGTGAANGTDALALGSSVSTSTAAGDASIVVGQNLNALQTWDIAIGADSTVNAGGGIAIGRNINVTGASAVAIGQNSNASAANAVALGSNSAADRVNTVSVGSDGPGSSFTRQIVNVGAGTQANDAVNVSQLSPMIAALGGGASLNTTTGAVTGPTYTLANGGTQTTVGGALGGLDGALTTTNGNVTNLQQQINDGTVGLVQQNGTSDAITVAAATAGSNIDFTGTAGARSLSGVANGINNTDAVNVSQLSPMIAALGGGASLNTTTGAVTGPTYTLANGGTQTTVGGALTALDDSLTETNTSVTNLDGRVTTNEGSISNLQTQLADGTVGLVQQNASTGAISVASSTGGTSVDLTGTAGARVLSGVANGMNDTDAVTIAQLKSLGVDPEGQLLGALHYDDLTLASATLGGTNGTTIGNLANGLIASGSMQAINGGQLFDFQQSAQNQFNLLTSQYNSLNDRVGSIEGSIADGAIGGPVPSPGAGSDSTQVGEGASASGPNSTAVGVGSVASGSDSTATGAGAVASGNNSTATGAGSVASGSNSTAAGVGSVASGSSSTADGYKASATGANSTALGANSSASGSNSVALGAGSVADRDNTVSVGSPGNERQITNVAAGTQRTDAANWGQVQDAVSGVQDWANQKFRQQDQRIDRLGAMGAAYGQMAFSAQGIQTANKFGVGVGSQGGQAALAIGYSRQLKPNMNVSFGGSTSGSEVSVGAGLSVGW